MPVYLYKALNKENNSVQGRVEADSLRDAREYIRKLNLTPTFVEEQSSKKSNESKNEQHTKKKLKVKNLTKLGTREKLDFVNSLYVLSKTGISLVESLLFIEINTNSKKTKRLSSEIRKMLLSGSTFSEAIQKYPDIFTPVYAGLIVAGEQSGELELTLERIIYLLSKEDKLRGKIISTMIYPCFVIGLAFVISLFMITFIFPKFKDMYDSMGQSLPLITKIFLTMGTFLIKNWFLLPIIIGGAIFSVYFIFTWRPTKQMIDNFSLEIPVVKTFMQFLNLSNFISVLKVSFDAGIPVMDGLILANLTITNYRMKESLKDIAVKIQHGQSLSNALRASGVIPGMVMCMIATGEEAGQLSGTLYQAEDYIDNQLERTIDILNKLLEPLLLLVIGSVALVLALALYLPLFRTYSNMM